MISAEDVFLDRYFLAPGSLGTVRSLFVSDDDIVDLFEADDLAAAKNAFISSLPGIDRLSWILAGEVSPPKIAGKPDYVRILCFLCWMQCTSLRQRGERDFREILEHQLGSRLQVLAGINGMWEGLRDFLKQQHDIDLDLPERLPHRQIGRTLRIAFPTWRDLVWLRKVRDEFPAGREISQFDIVSRVRRAMVADAPSPSFASEFERWNETRKRGDFDADDQAFWKAWQLVLSERGDSNDFEAFENQYGEVEFSTISPGGKLQQIDRLASSTVETLRAPIASAIRRGYVFMEDLGFGRYRSTDTSSRTILAKSEKLIDAHPTSVKNKLYAGDDWFLVTFVRDVPGRQKDGPTSNPLAIRWIDGIRVGSAYLGRSPLTPNLQCLAEKPAVVLDGHAIEVVRSANFFRLPAGIYSGVVRASTGANARSITLAEASDEFDDEKKLKLNDAFEVSEDGPCYESVPPGTDVRRRWSGHVVTSHPALIAIGEAFYARAVRGMPLSLAFDIASRGLQDTVEAPSGWAVIRLFADAGWIELTGLRHYPGRRALLRPLEFHLWNDEIGRALICGPIPLETEKRLRTAAAAVGVNYAVRDGLTEWSLPRHEIEAESLEHLKEFFLRSGVSARSERKRIATSGGFNSDLSLTGYSPTAIWNPAADMFTSIETPEGAGLYVFKKLESLAPSLYVLRSANGTEQRFRSPSLALLAYSAIAGSPFSHREGRLYCESARVSLPSTWARWLSDRTVSCPSLHLSDAKWSFVSACDVTAARALSAFVPIQFPSSQPRWADHFLASSSRADRHLYLAGRELHFTPPGSRSLE